MDDDDLYLIRESPEYTQQLNQLALDNDLELKHFRKALNIVFHIIARNPKANPLVNMSKIEMRMAKTEVYVDDEFSVPPLRFYYIVEDDERSINLIKIQQRRGFGL